MTKCSNFLIIFLAAMMFISPVFARTIAYVSNADSREIYVLELDEKNGDLRLIEKISVGGNVMPLVVSPDRKFLYAGLRSAPYSVSSFAINAADGKLRFLDTALLADNMAYVSIDRTGRYFFGASYSGNKISVNKINENGTISAAPLAVIPTGKNAHCILTDLSNKFLYVSNLGDDAIKQFKFDERDGTLTPNDPPSLITEKKAGPRHFIFHPSGRFLYGINELNGTINSYSINTSGVLSQLDSVSVMPPNSDQKPWAADLHLTHDGKFLYASERTTSSLSAFSVNSRNGKISFIGRIPTEAQPRGFNISPSGKYLLAAGQKSNSLSLYKIQAQTGKLQKVSQIKVGENPNWIEIIKLPS